MMPSKLDHKNGSKIRIPNETTLKTFAATDRGKGLIKAKNVRGFFAKAGF